MVEMRRYERVRVDIPTRINENDTKVRNLSLGGAFVLGLLAGQISDRVWIILDGSPLKAVVRWVKGSGEYGFGVEFMNPLSAETFRVLSGSEAIVPV